MESRSSSPSSWTFGPSKSPDDGDRPRPEIETGRRAPDAHGFIEVRQRGSHKQFRHADGRCTTVPFHHGRDISPTLLRKIAADVGMTVEEFLATR